MLQDPARRAPGGPIDPLRARQGPRRVLHHQRDDLHARPERGLRLLGVARQRRMVVGRRAAALQEGRGLSARSRRDARRWRRAPRGRLAAAVGDSRGLARRRRGMRHSENPRIQSRRQFRQRVLPDEPEARRALARDESVSPPALSRPNLTVITHALVERVRMGGRDGVPRAEGIEFAHPRDGDASRRRLQKPSWRRAASDRPSCCSSRAWGRRAARGAGHHALSTISPASARTCTTIFRSGCSTK